MTDNISLSETLPLCGGSLKSVIERNPYSVYSQRTQFVNAHYLAVSSQGMVCQQRPALNGVRSVVDQDGSVF